MENKYKINPKLKLPLLSLCIFLAVFILYFKVLDYGFTNLDDRDSIYTCAAGISSKTAILDAFKTNVMFNSIPTPYYRPMVAVSFVIDDRIAGQSISFAHFTCIFLHFISSVLIFFFLRRYLNFKDITAFLAAMLFAVHPATMYAAAWITGRNESIFFISFIISFSFFIEYINKKNIWLFVAHIFFMLMCFFTKESAVILPFIFFFYYLLTKEKEQKAGIGIYAAWILSIVFFMFMRKTAVPGTATSINLSADNIGMFFDYYSSMLFFRTPFNADAPGIIILLGSIAIILTAFFAFSAKSSKKIKKRNLFYFLLPFIILAPTLSASDRLWFQGNRMYTMFFAVIVLFFFFMSKYLETKKNKTAVIIISLLILFSAGITWKRSVIYKNGINFWGEIVKTNKHFELTAQKFYIYAMVEHGQFKQAADFSLNLVKTGKINDPQTIYAIAYAFYMNGNFQEAANGYEFLATNPYAANMRQQAYAGAILANSFAGNEERARQIFDNMCVTFQADPDAISQYLAGFKTYMENTKLEAEQKALSAK